MDPLNYEDQVQSLSNTHSVGSDPCLGNHDVDNPISLRSVVFLPPDKLYRKRTFDRINQRESRARKKDRIKCLEEENVELKAEVEALKKQLSARGSRGRQPSFSTGLDCPILNDRGPRIWQVMPLSIAPMCRLDQVMHHVVSSGQQPNLLQAVLEEIAQTSFPKVVSLLNPTVAEMAPVASLIGEHGPWMQMTSSAARTAVMYNVCLYLRWLLSPTETNYLALPSHIRPIMLQLEVAHPLWIDIMPWPRLRKELICDMDWHTEFEDFRSIHNRTVSVNWPYPLADILVYDSNNEISLNPLFEEHIRNLDNWSVGPELTQKFSYAEFLPQHPTDT